MKVISYNLRKHRAVVELEELFAAHEPDILCLQEAETMSLPARVGDLALAQSTTRNRLGLAVYYRDAMLRPTAVRAVALKKSMHDRVLRPAHERLVGVRFRELTSGRDFIVASFHAARRTASACIGALDVPSLGIVDDAVARRSGDQPDDCCAEATCDQKEALVASARQTKLRTWGAFIGMFLNRQSPSAWGEIAGIRCCPYYRTVRVGTFVEIRKVRFIGNLHANAAI